MVSDLAVSMTIGVPDSSRIARHTSMPSMPGSIRSSSTTSGLALRKASSAVPPSPQNTGSKPSPRSTIPSISDKAASSSTTSTRPRARGDAEGLLIALCCHLGHPEEHNKRSRGVIHPMRDHRRAEGTGLPTHPSVDQSDGQQQEEADRFEVEGREDHGRDDDRPHR